MNFIVFLTVLLSSLAINSSHASSPSEEDVTGFSKSSCSHNDEIKIYYESELNFIKEEYSTTYKSAQETKSKMQKSSCIDRSGNFINNPNSLFKNIFFKNKCPDMFYILLEQNARLAQLEIYRDHFEKLSYEYNNLETEIINIKKI